MFCFSWSMRATRNTSRDSWTHFHTHVVSFQKSPLQICRVSRRIWCLFYAPISCQCWNRKCEGTRGDKHSCCATPNAHTATPLGILSGDVPCSQAHCTHSRTAISWQSMELVSKLFDTPMYMVKMQCQIYVCYLYGMHVLSQQINIIGVDQPLICPHPFWHILEQCCKAVVIKHLYISGCYE